MTPLERFRRAARPLSALTAYSYPFARLLDEAGVDMILVGDSLGMVEHGREDTTSVTLDEMVFHTRSVRRGVQQALLVSDLPFATYDTPSQAVASGRELIRAGADVVKLEGGAEKADCVRALREEGIAVIGHLGMLPQKIREEGRYRIKGKTSAERERLLADAQVLADLGVEAIVLELVTPGVAQEITAAVNPPTIGIGSGPHCGGQILVTYDLLGLTPWFTPRFVRQEAHLGAQVQEAVRRFCARLHVEKVDGV